LSYLVYKCGIHNLIRKNFFQRSLKFLGYGQNLHQIAYLQVRVKIFERNFSFKSFVILKILNLCQIAVDTSNDANIGFGPHLFKVSRCSHEVIYGLWVIMLTINLDFFVGVDNRIRIGY